MPAVLGPYAGTGRTTRLYEELGYFVAGLDGVASYVNPEGSQLNFYIALNEDSLSLSSPLTSAPAPAGPMLRSVR